LRSSTAALGGPAKNLTDVINGGGADIDRFVRLLHYEIPAWRRHATRATRDITGKIKEWHLR
jgi:hypothetical protein